MLVDLATFWFRWLGGKPCFSVHAKGRREGAWRTVDVFATHRRDMKSRWPAPFWPGTCIAWTAKVIAVGWDFAEGVLREQALAPASREHPVEVRSGRLNDRSRREAAGVRAGIVTSSEILAHECGHTAQAVRMSLLYWPIGATFTLFQEGRHWWNWFENEASEEGQFGGIVNGSVHPELMARLKSR
jgi:hypothetical protein